METAAVVPATKLSAILTVDDLREAAAKAFGGEAMKVLTSEEGAPEKGAKLNWDSGPMKGQTLVCAYAILRRDQRAQVTFTKPNHAHDDAIVHFQEFDKEAAFAAALRIAFGDFDLRFRSRARVATLVRKVGVPEIAKSLPKDFSDFMMAVMWVVNCKLGKDVGEKVLALRRQIRELVPHLELSELVRIYKEEMVDWVNKS